MNEAAVSTLERPAGLRSDGRSEAASAGSRTMRTLLSAVERVAPTGSPVLLLGEPGAGKDWLAQLLHRGSGRRGPLQRLVCAGLTGERLGRLLPRPGELATHPETAASWPLQEGTLLLQEVGQLDLDAQQRLLEILDRLDPASGIELPPELDLRILATSTADLARSVQAGAFLPGLYYRLGAVELRVPPLRERREDIEGLVAVLMSELEQKYDVGPFAATDALLEALRSAPWPGNVRQLRSVLERAMVLSNQDLLDVSALPADWASGAAPQAVEIRIGTSLAEAERRLIEETLRAVGGHRHQAARVLGISRRKLHYRLRQWREEGLPI